MLKRRLAVQAAKRLTVALEETKKGDHRIETFNIKPREIKGNGATGHGILWQMS